MSTFQLIKSDLSRLDNPTPIRFLKWYFFPKGSTFHFIVWFRLMHAIRRNIFLKYTLGIFAYFIYRHLEFKYSISLNASTDVGPGLKIVHGGGVFLNCKEIGANFTVYQGVTLGSDLKNEIPTIKNNVTIYTGSVVVGDIILNDGCTVG